MYRCVRCGAWIDGGSRHHRQLRRSGDHTPANLVLLCGSGTTGCHGWVHAHPAEAYRAGLMVHTWDSATVVPVLTIWGWRMLAVDGTFERVTERMARRALAALGIE